MKIRLGCAHQASGRMVRPNADCLMAASVDAIANHIIAKPRSCFLRHGVKLSKSGMQELEPQFSNLNKKAQVSDVKRRINR